MSSAGIQIYLIMSDDVWRVLWGSRQEGTHLNELTYTQKKIGGDISSA